MINENRKGIILAGGSGTRLMPTTKVISKQILTVYDKPMIFYALSALMMSHIREILIISSERDINLFISLLGDGSNLGIEISYKVQQYPNGIAECFILGKEFLGDQSSALILGDNLFYGSDLSIKFKKASLRTIPTIFSCNVKNPSDYGIIELNNENKALKIVEKPTATQSHFAVTGFYFYDNLVTKIAEDLKPSKRGELEITDINNFYINNGELHVEILGRGNFWLDMGTHDSLLEASNWVSTIQNRQDMMICCPEEIAFSNKWISEEKLEKIIYAYGENKYSNYLKKILAKKQ